MVVSFIQKWGLWSHLCPEVGLGTEARGLLARCGEERSWGWEGAAPSPVLEGLGFLKAPGCEFSPGTRPSLSEGWWEGMLWICAGHSLQGGGGGWCRPQRGLGERRGA